MGNWETHACCDEKPVTDCPFLMGQLVSQEAQTDSRCRENRKSNSNAEHSPLVVRSNGEGDGHCERRLTRTMAAGTTVGSRTVFNLNTPDSALPYRLVLPPEPLLGWAAVAAGSNARIRMDPFANGAVGCPALVVVCEALVERMEREGSRCDDCICQIRSMHPADPYNRLVRRSCSVSCRNVTPSLSFRAVGFWRWDKVNRVLSECH